VAAVRDDVSTAIRLMKPVVDTNLLDTNHLREWAVFENVRSDPKFIEAFELEFGQKLVLDKETISAAKPSRPTGNEEDLADGVPESDVEGSKTLH
jgi:hypothetical protein